MVVDPTGVTFLDTRGIAALVEIAPQVNEHGDRLTLVTTRLAKAAGYT